MASAAAFFLMSYLLEQSTRVGDWKDWLLLVYLSSHVEQQKNKRLIR
jgi:hypothetical protein